MRTTGSGLNIFARFVSAAPSTPPDGAVGSGCAVGATSGVGCTPRSNVGAGAGVAAGGTVPPGVTVPVAGGVLTGVGVGVAVFDAASAVGVGVLTGVGVGVGVFTGVGVGVATGTVVTLAVGFEARQRMSSMSYMSHHMNATRATRRYLPLSSDVTTYVLPVLRVSQVQRSGAVDDWSQRSQT